MTIWLLWLLYRRSGPWLHPLRAGLAHAVARLRGLVLLLGLAIALSGCASVLPLLVASAPRLPYNLIVGQTTKTDVVALLGPPTRELSGGTVWSYIQVDVPATPDEPPSWTKVLTIVFAPDGHVLHATTKAAVLPPARGWEL